VWAPLQAKRIRYKRQSATPVQKPGLVAGTAGTADPAPEVNPPGASELTPTDATN
jgi:hypothetical protein